MLSPLLFVLFLNYLHEWLGGGVIVDGRIIRLFLYADHIVLFADSSDVLQGMIGRGVLCDVEHGGECGSIRAYDNEKGR